MLGVIYFAKIKKYKVHQILQYVLFIVSVIVVAYFEVGVRIGGGFDSFIEQSSVAHNYALIVLIIHILIAVVTLFMWILALGRAKKYLREGKHKEMGKMTFSGIVLTSLSGIWVYMLLFVY